MSAEYATNLAWVALLISWLVAASWSAPVAQRPGSGQEWFYRAVTITGGILLFGFFGRRIWTLGRQADWALFALALLSMAFTWWARIHLGSLWSSSVTKKVDHHVVDTGPYAIVRHPIYTGIIGAAAATAAQRGTLTAVAGAIIWTLGYWIKARLEERFLREQLGAEAYDAYRRRVPMLLPFWPKSD
jgi:protein-S-isoprenylcysteine O-methyltransferase Ste14